MITETRKETLNQFPLERHEQFMTLIRNLPNKLRELLAMTPISTDSLRNGIPEKGVYLFSEGEKHLYVGRSDRMPQRIRDHVSRTHTKAAFAFKLAREETGNQKASYITKGSRKELMCDEEFRRAFGKASDRIGQMELRYIEEREQVPQCLLEVYVAEVLDAEYNDFRNH